MHSLRDGSIVKIYGFSFFAKLETGKRYLIKVDEVKKVYWFCTPRSKNKITGFNIGSVEESIQYFKRNESGIEIVKY